MGLATAGDALGCPSVHSPLRLGRGASRGDASRVHCRRNTRRGGWPAVEAVNTGTLAVALVKVAAGPAHGPGLAAIAARQCDRGAPVAAHAGAARRGPSAGRGWGG